MLATAWLTAGVSLAQTPGGLLGGFDERRIAQLGRQTAMGDGDLLAQSAEVRGEWARLIFQLRRLSADTLAAQIDSPTSPLYFKPVLGRVVSVDRLAVPEPLPELLDLPELIRIGIRDDDQRSLTLIAPPDLPPLSPGDRLRGVAVLVSDDPMILAVGPLGWDPAASVTPGLESLRSAGVDLAAVRKVARLAAVPLGSADTPVFYSAIAAAQSAAGQPATRPPRSSLRRVGGVELLGGGPSAALTTGDWIATTVTMIRATRVGVQSAVRQAEIGGDHFWQIDAIADLGNVQVEVERPGGDPVRIGSRTPVSIVTARLPDSITGADRGALVLTAKRDVAVEGYFYRRWSYDSDLMDAAGGGRQVAPLIIAGRIEPIVRGADPVGVRWIGYAAAAGGLLLLLFGIGYAWFNSASDLRAKRVE